MTAALEGGEWSAARPGRTLPPGKTRYPLYRKLGGPQGRSGWAENRVPTGIRSRTFQHVVSLYTDSATHTHTHTHTHIYIYIIFWKHAPLKIKVFSERTDYKRILLAQHPTGFEIYFIYIVFLIAWSHLLQIIQLQARQLRYGSL